MPIYEIVVAIANKDDLPSGHKRQKAGDIIRVCAHPWHFGRKEIADYLIVLAQSERSINGISFFKCRNCGSVAEKESGKWHPVRKSRKIMTGSMGTCHDKKGKWGLLMCKTCSSNEWQANGYTEGIRQIFERRPLYEGGFKETEFRDINVDGLDDRPKDNIGLMRPEDFARYVIRRKDGAVIPRPTRLAKHRFMISFKDIKGLDMDKIRDPKCPYQPFKNKDEVCADPSFDKSILDCAGVGVGENTNLILSLETTRRIIKDKHDGRSIGANL